ncbi:MAG: single-stranded-DNA-specific exonuclease RecJ [Patescibacteria group bacterium]
MPTYELRKNTKLDSSLLEQLLVSRGIETPEQAESFLNPDYSKLHNPFLLKDARKAAERIIQAIQKGQKIIVYSDYDADGIPAGVIFHDFFKKIGFTNFINYIPHRHDEGFGLHVDAVKEFIEQKADLLITLDCGISDVEAVKLAQESGVDVIITDHHESHGEVPPAYAIVDHKQKGCEYPEKILCGSGVGFKLIQAILALNRFDMKEGHEKWLLDMVGLATLSDMVPLIGENRILAHYGMMVIKKSPRKGLVSLLSLLKINQRYITEDDLSFMVTPRINAASRMGVPMDAFRLLSTDDDVEAQIAAKHLDHINNERKGTVAALVKEVKKIITERHRDNPRPVIVAGNPLWRPSLLGLVANTCAEEFGKPVFLWGRDGDDEIKGSCRGGGFVSVVNLMQKVPAGVLPHFGGHAASGGFSVSKEAIHHVDEHLNKAYEILVTEKVKLDPVFIDAELSFESVNNSTYRDIERMAPFGVGNLKPLFIFKSARIAGVKEFGKEKNHLELSFEKNNGNKVLAIGFFMTPAMYGEKLGVGKSVDLVAHIEKSFFRGRPELRLRIVDVL